MSRKRSSDLKKLQVVLNLFPEELLFLDSIAEEFSLSRTGAASALLLYMKKLPKKERGAIVEEYKRTGLGPFNARLNYEDLVYDESSPVKKMTSLAEGGCELALS